MANETVTITQKEYDDLVSDSTFLGCLMGAGIDNWVGYEFALEEFNDVHPTD